MVDRAGLELGFSWFVILPDCASASSVRNELRHRATNEVTHPSGRPWVLGCWDEARLATGQAGQVKLAVLGQHAASSAELAAAAAQIASVGDVDRVAQRLIGSAHLLASIGGQVRVQGTVTGLRRVFRARFGVTTVAGDRADVLAALLGSAVDERRLAVHLLGATALYPVAGEPVWLGVSALPTDHYLVIDQDGRQRSVKWWAAPEPVVPIAEGAARLRHAMEAAVAARVGDRSLVSCDLGGLDSTSLCCLAAGGSAKVLAYTADGRDPMAEDVTWARRTVAGFGNVEHHVIDGHHLPMVYDGTLDLTDRLDEPCAAAICLDRYLFIPRSASARGSTLHLTGFGGDELLAGSPAHLHALVRTHPRLALRNTRGFATQRPWHLREALRQLSDSRPYGEWLAKSANSLTAPPPPDRTPTLDWGVPPRMPPWSTPTAVESVKGLISEAARTVEPLARGRGQHVELEAMRSTSRMIRHLSQMTAREGIALAAPYYDDRVLEAGLSVRPQERVSPWRYKPLIVEAMRGIVPKESLTRQTKDEGSHEVEVGATEHRRDLVALWEDSRLADLGLIDAGMLRELCSRPLPPALPYDALFQTVACEAWLRTLEPALTLG